MLSTGIQLSLPDWVTGEIDGDAEYPDANSRVALAIHLARCNVEFGSGGPFGAAVFDDSGKLLAVGVNRVVSLGCSVAHAEIIAMATAQARLRRPRLAVNGESAVLATSAQPCAMCYGACFWAGIDELLIGARAEDVTELTAFDEGPLPADWVGELERRGIRVRRDVLRDAARAVLSQYGAAGGEGY
ncbi:MAG TPA: nucleoside deaminase [Rhodanobacteraceae bacterium]|nr:nucleoside deaminase [Rhodanobacteraceae bacterium]